VGPPDIQKLEEQLDATRRDAQALVADLDDERGGWHDGNGSWSVAECLDHLATGHRVYLDAMEATAVRARRQGRLRRGPAIPGYVGRWFVWTLEPPVHVRLKAPKSIRPRTAPSLPNAFASFMASHDRARAFLDGCADLDLAGVRFPNPFVRGIRFSLATGLNVIAAHERRHLWQAWDVRRHAKFSYDRRASHERT
jgi:hypothetical protein